MAVLLFIISSLARVAISLSCRKNSMLSLVSTLILSSSNLLLLSCSCGSLAASWSNLCCRGTFSIFCISLTLNLANNKEMESKKFFFKYLLWVSEFQFLWTCDPFSPVDVAYNLLIKDFDFGAMLPEESNAMGIMQLLWSQRLYFLILSLYRSLATALFTQVYDHSFVTLSQDHFKNLSLLLLTCIEPLVISRQ